MSSANTLQAALEKIERLTAENERLKAIVICVESEIGDAKYNCGRYNSDCRKNCAPYIDRGRTCSDCPVDWFQGTIDEIARCTHKSPVKEHCDE